MPPYTPDRVPGELLLVQGRKQISTLDHDKDVGVMDTLDIALRLSAASMVGVVLGLNRDLHGKATGVRTLGVLCLGSALAVLSIHAVTGADASRVIQGVVTGVGFLGAGVIVRSEKRHHVQGLTTAACVWGPRAWVPHARLRSGRSW